MRNWPCCLVVAATLFSNGCSMELPRRGEPIAYPRPRERISLPAPQQSKPMPRPAPSPRPPVEPASAERARARSAEPVIAVTNEELQRLRQALAGTGVAHDVVVEQITRTDRAIAQPVEFPPRGGQHNEWYQCETCQVGLVTIDDTHHKCPKCERVYSGPPYDDVLFRKKHGANLDAMLNAAWAYAITGQQQYADFSRQVLVGYAIRYRSYPLHSKDLKSDATSGRLYEQTLNEAYALSMQIAPAYDLIYKTLAPADRQLIRTGLIEPMLQTLAGNPRGKNNWQSWHNAGMFWGGAVLNERSWMRRAIEDPQNGFRQQMVESITADGMWYENSWGYHFYALRALTQTAEGARRMGIDLWSEANLLKMFTSAAKYVMVGDQLPRFGDDVETKLSEFRPIFEAAYAATRDRRLAAGLGLELSWESILLGRNSAPGPSNAALGSAVFRSAGHGILRTDGPGKLTAAITFGPYGGFHGHLDKLSFVLYGYGQELAVDPGRSASQAYRLPIHENWYKATAGHNAVVVDRASQEPATGELESFAANDQYAAVVVRCDSAYSGVKQRRLLLLAPDYALVVDDLVSDRPRRFDWMYHNRGSSAESSAATFANHGPDVPAEDYLQSLRHGRSDRPVRVSFEGQPVRTEMLAAADGPLVVHTGDGPGASVMDRVPLAIFTRSGRTALFAAAIEPLIAGQTSVIRNLQVQRNGDGLQIELEKAGKRQVIRIDGSGQTSVRSGNQVLLSPEQ